MNNWHIEQGDALELMKRLPDESIDAVITDPPYRINYNSNRYKNGNPFSSIKNDHLIFFPIDEMIRVLKPTGALFAFYSFKRPVLDERIKNSIVWVKNNWTAGDLNGDFGNQYEQILFIPREKFGIHSKRYSNVWEFGRVPASELMHPTQKPLDLMQRLVEVSTDEGQIILDPFMGSGTTGVAALQLERNFIGYELDEKYFSIAKKRIESASMQTKLTLEAML